MLPESLCGQMFWKTTFIKLWKIDESFSQWNRYSEETKQPLHSFLWLRFLDWQGLLSENVIFYKNAQRKNQLKNARQIAKVSPEAASYSFTRVEK